MSHQIPLLALFNIFPSFGTPTTLLNCDRSVVAVIALRAIEKHNLLQTTIVFGIEYLIYLSTATDNIQVSAKFKAILVIIRIN